MIIFFSFLVFALLIMGFGLSRHDVKLDKISFMPGSWPAILVLILGFQIGLVGTFKSPTPPALGLAIFGLGTGIFWLALLKKRLTQPQVLIWWLAGLIFPALTLVRSSQFIWLLNFLVYFLSQIMLLVELFWPKFQASLGSLSAVIFSLIRDWLNQVGLLIRSGSNLKSQTSPTMAKVKTISLVVISLLIFTLLLSAADPVFGHLVGQLRYQLLERLIWTVLLVVVSVGWLTQNIKNSPVKPFDLSLVGKKDVFFILVALASLFAVFLTIQYKYLFHGSAQLLTQLNLTYSQYVRQGFIELLITVMAGGGLVYLAGTRLRQAGSQSYDRWLKWVAAIGLVELFFMLASAVMRNSLYLETYGVTRIRLFGLYISVGLAAVLLTLFFYVLWPKLHQRLVFYVISSICLLLALAINIQNVDLYILTQAPKHHDYTDYFYLSLLSPDVGLVQYTQLVPQMTKDLDQLLTKDELSAKDKYQLAGIKLALISLREKRNQLLLSTAPPDFVEMNSWKLGYDFPKFTDDQTDMSGQRFQYHDRFIDQLSLDDSLFATASGQSRTVMPKWLVESRAWQAWSLPPDQLSRWLQQSDELAFGHLDDNLRQLKLVQVQKQWDLSEEENKILYELKYPLISSSLNSYPHPESLLDETPDSQNPALSWLEQHQPLFLELMAQGNCPTRISAQTIAYGRLSTITGNVEVNKSRVELSFFSNRKLGVEVILPQDENSINTLKKQNSTGYEDHQISFNQLMKLDLELVSIRPDKSDKCTPIYQVKGWQNLKLLE